ncbi:hypothetical protein [Paraburkholderia caribensis]|uniref:hypothetical protein n=1 Tax=Paraburkholderia caribensis TaxID=75105 RepID=UPI00285E7CCE|nr:hypothetical protein [Paraburkholderia caribensis]MDR6383829.1 putative effector of murein hydrolase [Paraburkholderia caribensis]
MSIKFWVCLLSSTLSGLTVRVIACLIALSIDTRVKHNPIANLVLIAVTMPLPRRITGTPYRIFSDGSQFVHFLSGPQRLHLRCGCGGSGTS